MHSNVTPLPASTNYTPEQALKSAMQLEPQDVLIVGYDKDGDLIIRSSKMSRMDAVFLLEKAKEWALYSKGGRDET